MSRLEELRAMCEEAERYPLYTNYGNDMQYLVPGNPVRVPVKELIALLDVAEAAKKHREAPASVSYAMDLDVALDALVVMGESQS